MTHERAVPRAALTALILAVSMLAFQPTSAAAAISNCLPDARQASGAEYRICMPAAGQWNGDLVLFAHGYVAFNEPLVIPDDQLVLPDGTSVPQIVNALGFAFATTSYAKNGLAVLEGIDDLRDLVSIFGTRIAPARRVFLVGPSEGGIVTALAVERHPGVFDGGLSACGPIGDFRRQIDYIGDFRVVFDAYFPGILPGAATHVPDELIQNFETVYVPLIKEAVAAQPQRAQEVLNVTRAPVGLDPATVEETFVSVLWYAVFATNDASAQLGGQPFDNRGRPYTGSSNDLLLNLLVERADADPFAVFTMQTAYRTTGNLSRPLVTLHTLGDQIIPYWHEPLYRLKVGFAGSTDQHVNIPVLRYGHCNFNAQQVLVAFAVLLQKAGAAAPTAEAIERALPSAAARAEYAELLKQVTAR